MTPNPQRAVTVPAGRRAAGFVAAGLALSGAAFTGCGIVSAVKKVAQDVESNRSIIHAFTTKIAAGENKTFEATYATTGSSPTTIVYAIDPPTGLTFKETPAGSSASSPTVDVIVNSSGEYACSQSGSGAGSSSAWSCEKLPATNATTENKIFDFYTPAHWVGFLRDFSLAAGIAGDKVSASTMTVNGFPMSCVDFRASGVPGTSTICSTSQGILGYVKVASDSTSFQIKSYSASPQASLFELPPGAKVTTVTIPTTSTTS